MCGRTVCHQAPSCICRAAGRRSKTGRWSQPSWRDPPGGQKYYPSYNQAPTSYTPIMLSKKHLTEEELTSCADLTDVESPVTDDNGVTLETEENSYFVQPMHWGLVPSWHKGEPKSVGYNMINARSDGILSKRTFSVPLEKGRRCVALIDGYYEWQKKDNDKQPYYIYKPSKVQKEVKDKTNDSKVKQEDKDVKVKDEDQDIKVKEEIKSEHNEPRPMLKVAGLFDKWKTQEGETLYSFSMITVDAHKDMSWIHHRMPAFLENDDEVQTWLDYNDVPLKKAVEVIRPVTNLESHPVDKAVGNVQNKSPDLIKPVDPKKPKIKATPSSNFMSAWLNKGAAKPEKKESGRKRSMSESDKTGEKDTPVKAEIKEEGDEPFSTKRIKKE